MGNPVDITISTQLKLFHVFPASGILFMSINCLSCLYCLDTQMTRPPRNVVVKGNVVLIYFLLHLKNIFPIISVCIS